MAKMCKVNIATIVADKDGGNRKTVPPLGDVEYSAVKDLIDRGICHIVNDVKPAISESKPDADLAAAASAAGAKAQTAYDALQAAQKDLSDAKTDADKKAAKTKVDKLQGEFETARKAYDEAKAKAGVA